jgi:UDP-2,4-diacetamido-2,4,6-trideoxy-beta-L-altropyranose hydrolase
MNSVLIRADAGPTLGTGHVMRCLALAEVLRDKGWSVRFALGEGPSSIASILRERGFDLSPVQAPAGSGEDAERTLALADAHGADWVVADGYRFGAVYQAQLYRAGLHQLLIDDLGNGPAYLADLVLNPNVYAHPSLYGARSPHCRLLLGTRCALLRRELRRLPPPARAVGRGRNILVAMGGADAHNLTARVLSALCQVAPGEVRVAAVAGPANPHREALHGVAARAGGCIRIEHAIQRLPALMAWADLAVAAAGGTCLELAYMGVPALLVVTADNQLRVAEGMDEAGAARNLGWHTHLGTARLGRMVMAARADGEGLARMGQAASHLVDGLGGHRVVAAMSSASLSLRPATLDDAERLFHWFNDPETRRWSFSPQPVDWRGHGEWLRRSLQDPDRTLWVAESPRGSPVGQVRLDRHGATATLSVSLAPEARGRGLGGALIADATRRLFVASDVDSVQAFVRPDNRASLRAFEVADYHRAGNCQVQGMAAVRYALDRSERHVPQP